MQTFNIFIDCSTPYLIFVIYDNKYNLLEYKKIKTESKYLTFIKTYFFKILSKYSINHKNVSNIYTTIGPGSYTGIRVCNSVVKTFKFLNNEIKIYSIDSLKLINMYVKNIPVLINFSKKKYVCYFYYSKMILSEPIIFLKFDKNYNNIFEILNNFNKYKMYFLIDNKLNPITIKNWFIK